MDSTTQKQGRVMFDRGTHILALASDGLEVGDHVWFGEPRNIEAVVIDHFDSHHDGFPAPRCEVLPEYLPRRGILAGTWAEAGYGGFTTALLGEPKEQS